MQLTCPLADLKTIVEENGGAFSHTVIPECTHLIATQKEFDTKGSKGEFIYDNVCGGYMCL